MKWYEKFKVGQKVRVIKKVLVWRLPGGGGSGWNSCYMDKTIGNVYEIRKIDKHTGYQLWPEGKAGMGYWYPVESLAPERVKGQQLLFNFMTP